MDSIAPSPLVAIAPGNVIMKHLDAPWLEPGIKFELSGKTQQIIRVELTQILDKMRVTTIGNPEADVSNTCTF
ncbi:hypothetical protein DACRYDRAFT_110424 [Dacryopinax primogenitus]|uniref:Uncharacterized protein n=1 Tax=Dacryopinax primogenitus (strain DJM 731) TaxID=1858805 RepID=M5FUF2_DACPD|nr:uncharacterized protein DACRYDRAFT_110424 [Dacryopinax primogenitus]EJT99104.1 hypothetical protein DACRYDRAFT_110424 [Dacryopinax primogenitus]